MVGRHNPKSSMASAKRILLVDDEAVPRHSLAEQLTREGNYAVIEAGSAAEAHAAGDYHFAIIDLDDGDALARDLRKDGFAGPVLFLGEGSAGERLAKPFRLSALLARLSAQLGQHGEDRAVAIGPYQFRPSAKLLTAEGQRKIRLTEKETNILKFLHEAGRTVARETLLHEVWGYSPAVTTHTLETHIYRLRRKIEDDPARARILITEGGGYRLGA
jgi:DNA-binding response OmpR family regulator